MVIAGDWIKAAEGREHGVWKRDSTLAWPWRLFYTAETLTTASGTVYFRRRNRLDRVFDAFCRRLP